MRLTFGYLSLARLMTLVAISATPVDAGIRASFSLDHCSWNATDIVLVQTTAQDGVFSVVQSWKGHLKPGDSLQVPELKPHKDAVPISSHAKPAGFARADQLGISNQIPRQPIGSRMILFLKRRDVGVAASPPAEIETGAVGARQRIGRDESFSPLD